MLLDPLLSVRNLKKFFHVNRMVKSNSELRAVDDISFTIKRGETFGLVGESGCGKSTAGRTIMRLYEPTAGEVEFSGQKLFSLTAAEMRKERKNIQMVFQDPFSSLQPRQKVNRILEEPLIVHKQGNKLERKERISELLRVVGLEQSCQDRYPHQFSGGQRQRIGIARALATKPQLLIADEPVSALDVSIQSQILNLLLDLQQQYGLTYLFISHNLSVVEHVCNRVGVMYLGQIVELAERDELFQKPLHPYTQALLSAVPVPDPTVKRERIVLQGDVPSPIDPPKGCYFHPRCSQKMAICEEVTPILKDYGGGHQVACHLYEWKGL